VFEIAATVSGKPVRLGLDTLAGLSCVGRLNLTKEELSRAVSTSERLHHAGGESLQSTAEVTLDVGLGECEIKVTFNVIDTGRFPLGFLLGMDILEKHAFVLDVSSRAASFCGEVMPVEELEVLRAFREGKLALAGVKSVVCHQPEEEKEERRGWGDGARARVNAIRVESKFAVAENEKLLGDEVLNKKCNQKEDGDGVVECVVQKVEEVVVVSIPAHHGVRQELPGEKAEKKEKKKEEEKANAVEGTAAGASRNAAVEQNELKDKWSAFGKKCREFFKFDGWSGGVHKFKSCPVQVKCNVNELNLELECECDLSRLEVDCEKDTESDELTALVYDTGGYDFPTQFQLDGQLPKDHEVHCEVKIMNTEVEELHAEGDGASCGGSVRACERSWPSWFRSAVDDVAGTPPAFVNALATWLPESFDSGQARTLEQLGLGASCVPVSGV
jgi:hypothetical protein